jgi:hypothetical protein
VTKNPKRSFCNKCGHDTDHDVVWEDSWGDESPSQDLFKIEIQTLQCRGCRECAILKQVWEVSTIGSSELIEQTYEPPRLWRRAPNWLPSLASLDDDLNELLYEIYSATNPAQVRLLAMGVRSALDYVMAKMLEADVGSFNDKLDRMVEREYLTPQQRDNLEIVIDAGSASQHRGFKPSQDLLDEMLAVMESIIRAHYITGPMLETAKKMIPPRPSRPRKT